MVNYRVFWVGILGAIILTLLVVFGFGGGRNSPSPAPSPTPYSTNDPLWIVNHCNIPAVAAAHNLLC